MTAPIRLILVDDHSLCRRGLSDLLTLQGGMEVAATTNDGNEVFGLIKSHTPDLIVMDLRMPAVDGLSVLRTLRDQGFTTPVVILTMSDSPNDLAEALRLSVRGYLLKDMEPESLIESIRRVALGELVLAPLMSIKLSGLFNGGTTQSGGENALRLLTARERQILNHLTSGLSNKAIAQLLSISHETVKLHIRHILVKLGLTSRVQAAVYAVENKSTNPSYPPPYSFGQNIPNNRY
jgi:two-component system nitrate/nitrite response regulator NarL